jgi:TetR/AcrR family transcriptional regulator, tetracycline repressor protein
MPPPERRRGPGRPSRGDPVLSRERVLAAALALLDECGLDGLTIRGLARRLDVTPMSLYTYVASRDQLLDVVHEAVLAEAMPAPTDADRRWRSALHDMATTLRAGLRTHPRALLLFAPRPVRSPALIMTADRLLQALLAAGFTARQAIHAVDGVSALTVGHAFAEFGTGDVAAPELDGSDLTNQVTALRQAGWNSLARVVAEAAPINYDEEFDQAITAILDGLQARITGQDPGRSAGIAE